MGKSYQSATSADTDRNEITRHAIAVFPMRSFLESDTTANANAGSEVAQVANRKTSKEDQNNSCLDGLTVDKTSICTFAQAAHSKIPKATIVAERIENLLSFHAFINVHSVC